MDKKINSVKDIKSKFSPPKNVNVIHRSKLTRMDKLALFVTNRIGTMGFFFIIFSWTIIWLSFNILAPKELRFDPYPAFVLWLFISNLIQIHLMPLIMVGQNIQAKHAQLRADHDFEIDEKSEKEIETILLHLENQEKILNQILEKLKKTKPS